MHMGHQDPILDDNKMSKASSDLTSGHRYIRIAWTKRRLLKSESLHGEVTEHSTQNETMYLSCVNV